MQYWRWSHSPGELSSGRRFLPDSHMLKHSQKPGAHRYQLRFKSCNAGGFLHSSNAVQSCSTRIVNFAESISVLACSAMEYHFGSVMLGAISGASVSDDSV